MMPNVLPATWLPEAGNKISTPLHSGMKDWHLEQQNETSLHFPFPLSNFPNFHQTNFQDGKGILWNIKQREMMK